MFPVIQGGGAEKAWPVLYYGALADISIEMSNSTQNLHMPAIDQPLRPPLEFCRHLLFGGTAVAGAWLTIDVQEMQQVEQLIRQAHAIAAEEAPARPPQLNVDAAAWALSTLAWSVRVLVDRADLQTTMPELLARAEPRHRSAAVHWSTDLGWRHLAGVLTRAQAAATEDPLIESLTSLVRRWPLAAIGTGISWSADAAGEILRDQCLRRVMLDRIALRLDHQAASHPDVVPYRDGYHFPPALVTEPPRDRNTNRTLSGN